MATKLCAYFDCDESIGSNYTVCQTHYRETLEPCPDCGRLFKVSKYDKCRDCFQGKGPKKQSSGLFGRVMDAVSDVADAITEEPKVKKTAAKKASYRTPAKKAAPKKVSRKKTPTVQRAEAHAPQRDAETDIFYAYILDLDGEGGQRVYYPGQTNNLRARLEEHNRGETISTRGKNPTLRWFTRLQTRQAATDYEKYLQELIRDNPRAVTRMVIEFDDLVRELGAKG
jgi:predicted GIY-YIG superfamily endonuclease